MDRVPFIACINLLEREDRYNMVRAELERAGILDRVHWHRPHKSPQGGRVGCFESHLAVFQAALEAGASFAVVFEDDVRLSPKFSEGVNRLLALADSGVPWMHASLQNSGGEVLLTRSGDDEALPQGVRRAAFYFTRCYAIAREAMEQAIKTGITRAHVDVALAVANWGSGFIIRPACVLDVPSESDNDWAEGGLGPRLAGKMQGFTHLPCVIADRWKVEVMPHFVSQSALEAKAWDKFMAEPGSDQHLNGRRAPPRNLPWERPQKLSAMGCCCPCLH